MTQFMHEINEQEYTLFGTFQVTIYGDFSMVSLRHYEKLSNSDR